VVAQQPEPVTPSGWQDLLEKVTPEQWGFAGDAWKAFETARTATNLLSPGGAQTGRGLRQYERLPPEQQQQLQEGGAYAVSGVTPIAAILGRGAPAAARLAPIVAGRTVPPLLKLAGRAAKGFVSGGTKTAAPLVAQDLASRAQETDRANKAGMAEEAIISPEERVHAAAKASELHMDPWWENMQRRGEDWAEAADKAVTEDEARNTIVFQKQEIREAALADMTAAEDRLPGVGSEFYGYPVDPAQYARVEKEHQLTTGQEPTAGLAAKRRAGAAGGVLWDTWNARWNSVARAVGAAYYLADRYGVAGLNPFTGVVDVGGVPTEIDRKRAWEVGQEYFQHAVPTWIQFIAPWMLDPDRALIHPLRHHKHIRMMQHQVTQQLVSVDAPVEIIKGGQVVRSITGAGRKAATEEVLRNVKAGTAFYSQPISRIVDKIPGIRHVFKRTPKTIARLTAETSNRWLETLTVGRTKDEMQHIMTGVTKYLDGDIKGANEIFANYPTLMPRNATSAEKALLGKTGTVRMDPFRSSDAIMSLEVLRRANTKEVSRLLDIIDQGIGTGKTIAQRRASEDAAVRVLEYFARAANDVAGVPESARKPIDMTLDMINEFRLYKGESAYGSLKSVPQGVTRAAKKYYKGPGAGSLSMGAVIRGGDKAMGAYQGFLARWTQLNSFGRVARDGMVSITEGLMDGVLGVVPKNWWQYDWMGRPPGLRRGVGVGGERLTAGLKHGRPPYRYFGEGRTIGPAEARAGFIGRLGDMLSELPGAAKTSQENFFARMPMYVGIQKVFRTLWRPRQALRQGVWEKLVEAVGEPRAKELMRHAETGYHPDDITRAASETFGGSSRSLPGELHRAVSDVGETQAVNRMKKAKSAAEVDAIFEQEKLRIIDAGTDFSPGTLEGDGYLEDQIRKNLRQKKYPEHKIEQDLLAEMSARAANRGPSDVAQSAAFDTIRNIEDVAKREEALAEFFRLGDEWKGRDVAAEASANRILAREQGFEFWELNDELWKNHWTNRAEAYHQLRRKYDPLAQEILRYDDDVVRAAANGTLPRNVAPITETQQKALDDYFLMGGKFESAAADVIDPVINAAAAKAQKVRELRRAATHIKNNWNAFPNTKLDPAQAKVVSQVVAELKEGIRQIRGVAEGFGTALRDMTYYNYGDKRNFDMLFRWMSAYPHWYSRQAMRSSYRFLENPHAVVALNKMRDTVEGLNEDSPEWLKPYIRKTLPDGGMLSLPVMQYVDPQDAFLRSDFHNPEILKTPSGRVYTALNDFGPGSVHSAYAPILAQLALRNGNKELARAYTGRFGLTSSFLGELGHKLGSPVETALPEAILPGSFQLMSVDTPEGEKFVGTPYDMDKVGKLLIAKADKKIISQEQLLDVMLILDDPYNQKYMQDLKYASAFGLFLDTISEMRDNKIWIPGPEFGGAGIPGPLLMSWLVGPRPRYDSPTEVGIMEAQKRYGEIRTEVDGLFATGSAEDAQKGRQIMRSFWTDPANAKYSNLLMWRNTGHDLLASYAWNVLSRTGPGMVDNKIKGSAGADINYELLREFYDVGGIPEDWDQLEQDTFMTDMMKLGAVLQLPDLPTRNEWKKAADERTKLVEQAYVGVDPQTIKDYERFIFDRDSIRGEINDWIAARPQVELLEDKIINLVMNHKLVASYYTSQKMVTDYYMRLWEMEHPEGYEAQKFYYEHADFYGKERADAWKKNEGLDRVIAEYFDARSEYMNTGLRDAVRNFENSLPDTRLWDFRDDVSPEGNIWTENVKTLELEQRNPAVALEEADMGGMPSDAHRAAYDRNKDLSTETWMDTLKPDYDIGFGQFIDDNDINQALWNQYEEISLFDRFPVSAKGVPGIVAYVQQNGGGSIREAMMTETMGGNFTKGLMAWRVLGTIQNLPHEELEKLKLQYPELSDVDMVYWALYGEAEPTLGILLKSMGLSGSVSVDGKAKTNKVSGITALTPEQVFKKEDIFGSLVIDEDNKFLDTGDVHEVVRRIADQYIEPGIERQYETHHALLTALRFAEADALYESNPNIEKFTLLKEMVFDNFKAASLIPGSDKWVKFRKEMDSTLKTGGIEALLKLIDEKGLKAVKGLVKDVKKGARITRTPRTRSSRGRTTRSILHDFHALRTGAIEATQRRQAQRRQAQRQQVPLEQEAPNLKPWLSIHAKWTQEKNPMLVMLMDYFDLSAYARQAHLQRNPDLARWLSTVPAAQLAAIERAYYIWAQQTGRLTPRQERRVSRSRPALASTLRVYKPRGERAGI